MRAMHELHNNLNMIPALVPLATAVADNTAQVSQIIDMQGYEALEFYIITGTVADADVTVAATIDHGDQPNLSDAAAAPSECFVGTLAAAGFRYDDDSAIKKIGVVPSKGAGKRYWRLTLTPSNNTGAIPMAVMAARLPLNYPAA